MTSQCRKNYLSIPRPLYPEVKGFRGSSPFSSSVVCVRKKDGGMRLCVHYRELKKKTVPDRHPIPRLKEALGRLGGNSWFSVFDQGKAYQQGFIGKQSQPLPPDKFSAIYEKRLEKTTRWNVYPLVRWYYSIFRVIFRVHWTSTQGTSTLKESWGEVESSYV